MFPLDCGQSRTARLCGEMIGELVCAVCYCPEEHATSCRRMENLAYEVHRKIKA